MAQMPPLALGQEPQLRVEVEGRARELILTAPRLLWPLEGVKVASNALVPRLPAEVLKSKSSLEESNPHLSHQESHILSLMKYSSGSS